MNYILTSTAKRKNAKRHIVAWGVDLETARRLARNINKKYIVEVYTGNWKLVERMQYKGGVI